MQSVVSYRHNKYTNVYLHVYFYSKLALFVNNYFALIYKLYFYLIW